MQRDGGITDSATEPYERAYQSALRSQLLHGLPAHAQRALADVPLAVIDRASRLWEDGRRGELVIFLRALQRARARHDAAVHRGRRFAVLLAIARCAWNRRRLLAVTCATGVWAYSLVEVLGERFAVVELVEVALALMLCLRLTRSRAARLRRAPGAAARRPAARCETPRRAR